MLQFGYNTGVINAPEINIESFMKDVYKDRYGEDIGEEFIQQLYSVAVSIFAIGGMLGGFSGGWMANRFGRCEFDWRAANSLELIYNLNIPTFIKFTGKAVYFWIMYLESRVHV